MLVWYRPKANEVNFLPWLEHYIQHKQRKRMWLYSATVAIMVLGGAWFGVLYTNLLQAQADLQQHLSTGSAQLQTQKRSVWASSLEQRRKLWHQAIEDQQKSTAWLPVAQLSKLLMQLNTSSDPVSLPKLVSWQWQPTHARRPDAQDQVVFTIAGQQPWQAWWQQALKVWPAIHMETLAPEGEGWNLKASYFLQAQPKTITRPLPLTMVANGSVSATTAFALQLTPPAYTSSSADKAVENQPFAAIAKQLEKYGKGLKIVQGQGVQANISLDPTLWSLLAPLPSAVGWWLQGLSIDHTPSDQWQVSMQWLAHEAPSLTAVTTLAPSEAAEANIHEHIQHYANMFAPATFNIQVPAEVLSNKATPKKATPKKAKNEVPKQLAFVGYSAQQDKALVAWIRSLKDGRLIQAEVGHIIEGWRVSSIGAAGVSLTLGQQQTLLRRACLTGVCE